MQMTAIERQAHRMVHAGLLAGMGLGGMGYGLGQQTMQQG